MFVHFDVCICSTIFWETDPVDSSRKMLQLWNLPSVYFSLSIQQPVSRVQDQPPSTTLVEELGMLPLWPSKYWLLQWYYWYPLLLNSRLVHVNMGSTSPQRMGYDTSTRKDFRKQFWNWGSIGLPFTPLLCWPRPQATEAWLQMCCWPAVVGAHWFIPCHAFATENIEDKSLNKCAQIHFLHAYYIAHVMHIIWPHTTLTLQYTALHHIIYIVVQEDLTPLRYHKHS